MAMRDRSRRHIRERTDMLAGVSHDLRTPLTRMKLQLSLMPPGAEAEELTGDVEEMEKMVGAYLPFARGQSEQPADTTDILGLIHELDDDDDRRRHDLQVVPHDTATRPMHWLRHKRARVN